MLFYPSVSEAEKVFRAMTDCKVCQMSKCGDGYNREFTFSIIYQGQGSADHYWGEWCGSADRRQRLQIYLDTLGYT